MGQLRLPLGDGLLGRVVDAQGMPMDRMGPIRDVASQPLDRKPINAMDRAPIRDALDTGVRARHESSIVKAFVSEELFKVADRCVQILGGIGVTGETVVEMIFRDIRGFRLYDGPTEVHKYAIANQLMRKGSTFDSPV